jgi:hypothetical protein
MIPRYASAASLIIAYMASNSFPSQGRIAEGNGNGDRLLFSYTVELHLHRHKNKIPLSFKKRGCAKSAHTFLSIVEFKGDYTIVLNIRLKLR